MDGVPSHEEAHVKRSRVVDDGGAFHVKRQISLRSGSIVLCISFPLVFLCRRRLFRRERSFAPVSAFPSIFRVTGSLSLR